VIEDVKQLRRGKVGIGKHHASAERQRRVFGPEAFDNILAEDGQNVAALQTERSKPARHLLHALEHLAPGVADPDAMLLFAHAGAIWVGLCSVDQKLRQRFASGRAWILAAGGFDDHCFACPR